MIKVESIGPNESIGLDPREAGFAYGMAVFETIKVAGGRVYFWSRHWRRFQKSIAECFGYNCSKVDEQVLLSALAPLAKDYALSDFMLKLSFMMRSDGPSVFLYGRAPFPCPSTASLCLNLEYPIDEVSILKGHKTHNYIENMWLRKAAQAAGFTDYLRVNRAGYVCETSTANCFFIREGKALTASTASGIIPGVIRECLIETMGFETGDISVGELASLEAAFITNSSVELVPVERIEGFLEGGSVHFDPVMHPLIAEAIEQLKIIARAESIDLDF